MVASLLSLAAVMGAALALPSNEINARAGGTTYGGVNIAGFDFGCSTDGTCQTSGAQPPLTSINNGPDGIGQMKHFANDRGMNIFRLPVGWQYLVNNGADITKLDAGNLANYDKLVQGCLATGAKCIIDIHNYARYNGAIIGQGGPSNAQFAALWSALATKYKGNANIVYGIMNEPHDLDVNTWGQTVQAAVTAIRKATGNNNNLVLLPGTLYTSAGAFVSDGSFDALNGVKNADGSNTNLIFDVHQYLDSDFSGTHSACVTDGTQNLQTLQTKLASAGRQAILSETGGGSSDGSCLTDVCNEIGFLNQHPAQFIGYTGWAAGSFATSYVLSLTPTNNGGSWTDQPLTKCFAKK